MNEQLCIECGARPIAIDKFGLCEYCYVQFCRKNMRRISSPDPPEPHYTPKQCAEIFGGARRTWERRARSIGAVKIGGTWHIPESNLQEFLDRHRTTPKPCGLLRPLMKQSGIG